METEQERHLVADWLKECEEGKRGSMFICGLSLFISPQDLGDGSVVWVPSDQGAYIPSREAWDGIVVKIEEFYRTVSSKVIEEHNLALDARYFGPRVRSPSQPAVSKRKSAGYVYVLRVEGGLYKIGLSRRPEERLKSLVRELPYESEVVCVIPSQTADTLERTLHSRFADKRVHGEWFRLDPSDAVYLATLAVEATEHES